MDVCEVIAKTQIGEGILGTSNAMKVIAALDEAGLIIVGKPTYDVAVERGSGECTIPSKPKPTLTVV